MSARNPFENRDVLSRRGGATKELLSRDRIVTEALRLVTQDGAEGMSLRKVAAALDTGPASLYAYVDDLRSLQALVLDRALADVDISGGKRRGWRERLKSVLESYARVLLESPGLAHLALGAIAVGPHALGILDTLLGLLEEGGVDRPTAAWAVDLLTLYVTAIAAEHGERPSPSETLGPVAYAIARAPADKYPHVHQASAELVSGEGKERFSWAIDVILSGLLERPRPRAKPRAVQAEDKARAAPKKVRRAPRTR
jgi:AcrR family transcriptional regulator